MPRSWHDRHSANKIEDEEERNFYRSIVADKKPYFMRYIYPALAKQYNTYIKNTDRNSLREFQLTVSELKAIPKDERSERQNEFIKYFNYRLPVGTGDCVMNKICRRFESEFDGYIRQFNSTSSFDYTIMKSGVDYSRTQYNAIKKIYEEYNRRLQNYLILTDCERIDDCDSSVKISVMNEEFKRECVEACQNECVLCDILLDLCYSKNSTKRFVWSMCGREIIHNLLKKNNNTISFPVIDSEGNLYYCGETFSVISKRIEEEEE